MTLRPGLEADDVNFGIAAAYRTKCRHEPPSLISSLVSLEALIKL